MHAEGCELLARVISPTAKRPPAFAAAAVGVARAVIDGSRPATVDGITVALELISLLSSAPSVQDNARSILTACATVCRAHPEVEIIQHNVFCVACNMVNVGGRPVADLVVGTGLLLLAGRTAATCPTAVETCMSVLEFGAGITEACVCGLADMLRESAPEAALVVFR